MYVFALLIKSLSSTGFREVLTKTWMFKENKIF